MRFFQVIRNSLATMGVYEHQKNAMSLRTIVHLGHLATCAFCALVYFLLLADNISDFAQSFYLFATCTFIVGVLSTFALKGKKISHLFEGFEAELERRKI